MVVLGSWFGRCSILPVVKKQNTQSMWRGLTSLSQNIQGFSFLVESLRRSVVHLCRREDVLSPNGHIRNISIHFCPSDICGDLSNSDSFHQKETFHVLHIFCEEPPWDRERTTCKSAGSDLDFYIRTHRSAHIRRVEIEWWFINTTTQLLEPLPLQDILRPACSHTNCLSQNTSLHHLHHLNSWGRHNFTIYYDVKCVSLCISPK